MLNLLNKLVEPGTDIIIFVQSLRTSFLDLFFRAITFFGEVELYMVIFLFIYLNVNKSLAKALVYITLFSSYLNTWLKNYFNMPRPDNAAIVRLMVEKSPSFPSGHAQNSLVFWTSLGLRIGKWFLWIIIIPLLLLIGFSRVYLGVHFPQDILGGWIIGIVIVTLWEEVFLNLKNVPAFIRLLSAIFIPLTLLIFQRTMEISLITGTIMGLSIGFFFEEETLSFDTKGSVKQILLRCLMIPFIFFIYFGLKVLIPQTISLIFLRQFFIGFFISYLNPLILVKFGLLEKRSL